MGSSAGALISLYAICEYPEVFGGAGCVSTHFPLGKGIMLDYMKDHLPDPQDHNIYFDYGTGTLDAEYAPFQKQADEIMVQHGYKSGVNWLTKFFDGHTHSEVFWRERVHYPLEFLLKRENL
jgi:predicted alpha/beta superfamily hydrolase